MEERKRREGKRQKIREKIRAEKRERKDKEYGMVVIDTTFGGGARNYISHPEGPQAVFVRLSGRGNIYIHAFIFI
jgi:hypothetical protein